MDFAEKCVKLSFADAGSRSESPVVTRSSPGALNEGILHGGQELCFSLRSEWVYPAHTPASHSTPRKSLVWMDSRKDDAHAAE